MLNHTNLQRSILRLDGYDLIPHQFQNPVHHRLETLQNLLVSEGHITFLNAGLRELSLDTNINSPFLSVVAEISLDSILKVHDALRVDFASCSRTIGQFHLANLGA